MTVQRLNETLDGGEILAFEHVPIDAIDDADTWPEVGRRLFERSEGMLAAAVPQTPASGPGADRPAPSTGKVDSDGNGERRGRPATAGGPFSGRQVRRSRGRTRVRSRRGARTLPVRRPHTTQRAVGGNDAGPKSTNRVRCSPVRAAPVLVATHATGMVVNRLRSFRARFSGVGSVP